MIQDTHHDLSLSHGQEGVSCEPEPPPLRIYATVGVTSQCCVADGLQRESFNVRGGGGVVAAETKEWGFGGFLGYQKAEAGAIVEGTDVAFNVQYMEDNVVLTSTFKVCWWTCGGYAGKHVEIRVEEEGKEEVRPLTNACLPPNSADGDYCCYTYTVVDCIRCSELHGRQRRLVRFKLTVVDGCGRHADCELTALTP